MTSAAEYNAAQLASGALAVDQVTELVRFWQLGHGLEADGKAGPNTLASIGNDPIRIVNGWLVGPRVTRADADPSWFGGSIYGGMPGGIVAHFTDTGPGTAVNMAKRRQRIFGTDPDDRAASWHVTIETDGSIVQMIPFGRVAWHAGSSTAVQIPGLGWANNTTAGIELVGLGDAFPDAQVAAAKLVWRALVRAYGIRRKFAMVTHQSIDPTRRDDPGPVWMGQHADSVLAYAYGS